MIDHLNRNSVRAPALRNTRIASQAGKNDPVDRAHYTPPPRPHPTFVPAPEILESLIERALAAFARGIYWDRGSIINILL